MTPPGELAPVAFFAFNRPDHTRRALESLSLNAGAGKSRLFVFCDAPRRPGDDASVREVRALARSRPWCGTVHVEERPRNMGCAGSIVDGVTRLCAEYGRVIVVEDDLVLAPGFLDYMNRALRAYEEAPEVMQVSGYMFPVALDAATDAVFLPFTTTWGWATWERAWRHFDPAAAGYARLREDRRLRRAFDLGGTADYFGLLEKQLRGDVDSWGIRWYLSVFLRGGLVLHPVRPLVANAGFDGSGRHCPDMPTASPDGLPEGRVGSFPAEIAVDRQALAAVAAHFRRQQPPGFRRRHLRAFLRGMLGGGC